MARPAFAGIVSSTFLTLILLPALYRLWHRTDDRLMDETDKEHLEHPEVIAD